MNLSLAKGKLASKLPCVVVINADLIARIWYVQRCSNSHLHIYNYILHTGWLFNSWILLLAFEDVEEDPSTIHPEWFTDAPEELDVCVAQRHFEDALALLQKAKEYINQFIISNGQADHVMIEIQRKVLIFRVMFCILECLCCI